MNAVDTNVLVYAFDHGAGEKRARAIDLLATLPVASTVVPWQVVCECAAVLCRIADHGRARVDPSSAIEAIMARFAVADPPDDLVLRALRLRQAHQVSYWDAMLLSACAAAGVERLYTEDMQSSPVIDGVQIINPFV